MRNCTRQIRGTFRRQEVKMISNVEDGNRYQYEQTEAEHGAVMNSTCGWLRFNQSF